MLFIDDFEKVENAKPPNRCVFDAFALFPYPHVNFSKNSQNSLILRIFGFAHMFAHVNETSEAVRIPNPKGFPSGTSTEGAIKKIFFGSEADPPKVVGAHRRCVDVHP